jgi:hypothetical protein
MAFGLSAMLNASAEVAAAGTGMYTGATGIRLFTVGQATVIQSEPLDHLVGSKIVPACYYFIYCVAFLHAEEVVFRRWSLA